MTTIDKIFFPLFVLLFAWLMFSCDKATSQEPSAVNGFGAALQSLSEPKTPKPVGDVEKVEIKQPSLAAMQLTINLANYYATRCLEDGTVNEECLNEAMKCAGQLKQQDNMTDALLKCAKSINP